MGKARQLRRLRKAAELFPTEKILVQKRVLGSELMKADPTRKDHMGKPIDPKRFYICDVEQDKSHYNEMKKIYLKGGIQAVNIYLNETAQLHEHTQMSTAEINSGLEYRMAQTRPFGL